MSFGGSTSEQSAKNQSQSQSYYDPAQTGLVDANAQATSAAAAPGGALAYSPYTGAPLNFGDGTALTNLTTYKAPSVTASTYSPTSYTASTVDPSTVGNVAAGQLASTNLDPYLNPYTGDVINTTTAALARQKNVDDTALAGQATAAGAFGGSRSGVLQGQNDDAYMRNLDQTVAGLNQANYTQAQTGALNDINNRLTADTTNLSKNLAVAQGNQTATNTAAQYGATAANTASQFDANQTQTASTADQAAALASAQTQLQALGISQSQAQALFGANWAQYLNSQTDPQAVQSLVNQAYGIVPTGALSQSSSSGSSQGLSASYKAGT